MACNSCDKNCSYKVIRSDNCTLKFTTSPPDEDYSFMDNIEESTLSRLIDEFGLKIERKLPELGDIEFVAQTQDDEIPER
jgi:hypothetical protein